jgi:tetratricopeptide (TPR) repeat protein
MSLAPRAGYGALLAVIAVLILAGSGAAVATLLRQGPALQVNVFGVAGRGDRPRSAAAEIRAAGSGIALGRIPGDLGIPLAMRPFEGPAGPATPYPGWTTLGLGTAESLMLDRARRLAQAGQAQAALATYDSLLARRPASDDVAVERARVLSWSGSTAAAGDALAAVAERRADPALRIEAARNLYWAAQFARADELLDRVADAPSAGSGSVASSDAGSSSVVSSDVTSPNVPTSDAASSSTRTSAAAASPTARPSSPRRPSFAAAALALRDSIRRADNPTVERARRWVRERGGAMENLALARAFVRERRPAASLSPYRAALRLGGRDSLRLELASAALEADSPAVAAVALAQWLERHPADRDTRLQRARALAWSRDYPAAAGEYARVLETRDDATVRYELAEAQTWAGDSLAAHANLERVVSADPRSARAWRLLGDLDRWAGRWALSLERYARAREIDPALEGIDAAMAEDREGVRRLRAARLAGIPAAAARVEGMGDSEGFRWSAVEGSKQWLRESDLATVAVRARLEQVTTTGPGDAGQGIAVAVDAARPLSPRLRAAASLGAESMMDHLTPIAAAQLAYASPDGRTAALRVVTEPAVRRTATLTAVEAGVVSSRVEATAAAPMAGVTVDGALSAERLAADAGSTGRMEASLGATRVVTPALRLSLSASGLTTSRAAPTFEGRSMYWSPRGYLQAQLGAALRRRLHERLELELRAAPGVAWVDERSAARRFAGSGVLPSLAAGGELRYGTAAWAVVGAVDWSGVGLSGYRSTGARVFLTRAVRAP